MLQRIDLPTQASQFTNDSEGNQPYNSKYSKPISKIEFTDTPFLTNSHGLTATWYNNAKVEASYIGTSYVGNISGGLLKFWWDYGIPPQITDSETNLWGVKIEGYFCPPYTGDYEFYLGGHGYVNELNVDSTDVLDTDRIDINKVSYNTSDPIGLTTGEWVNFRLRYRKTITKEKFAGLTCLYRMVDNDTSMPDEVVLSPGVTAPISSTPTNDEMPISSTVISSYNGVSVSYDNFGAQVLKFTVPFIENDTSYNFRGFYKSGVYEFTDMENTSIVLKQFRKIEYYEGYVNTSGIEQMVQKFAGHIRGFDIDYSSQGDDKLTITCVSPLIFTKDQFAEHLPNPIDYICAGYFEEIYGYVNGKVKPRCYDGWEVSKVFKNILLNSYIDPVLFYKKKELVDYDNNLVDGGYLIDYTSTATVLYLPTQKNYGNIANVAGESAVEVDDEYVYTADTGEYLYDVINKMVEHYAFRWGFTEKGYPFLKGVDVPTEIYDDRDLSFTGAWTGYVSPHCVKGTYKKTTVENAFFDVTGYGSRIDLILRVDPQSGTTDEDGVTIQAQIRQGGPAGSLISTVGINPYYNTAWSYYNGPDTDGENPTFFHVATNLPYGQYTISVINQSGVGSALSVDAVHFYDEDINSPSFIFYTGDTIANGQVVSLSSYESADDIRNVCVVLGKRTGTRLTYISENVYGEVNPNNPIWTYYSSKVADLNSLSSPLAGNYAGRPLKTIIVEPDVTSQRQADFIAFNFVNENRMSHQELKFETLGNPMIQIGDCINVIDTEKEGITSYKKMWVNVVNSIQNEGKYLTRFDAVDVKPLQSYYQKPQPDLDEVGDPIQNVRIFNGGAVGVLTSNIDDDDTEVIFTPSISHPYPAFSRDDVLENMPKKGYIKLTSGNNTEIIKYDGMTDGPSGNSIQFENCTRGLQGTDAQSWSGGDSLIAAWDQYTQDGMSITPIVMFDLYVDGEVEILVKGIRTISGIMDVARLTNQHQNVFPYDGYNDLVWGANHYFTWNGCDDFGHWNTLYNYDLPTENRAGFFAVEPYDLVDAALADYGEFFMEIKVTYADKTYIYPSDVSETTMDSVPRMYTRRGPISEYVSFNIIYDNTYSISELGAATYHETDPGVPGYYTHGRNFYITSTANGGRMVKYKMIDEHPDYGPNDPDYVRLYQAHIIGNVDKYFGFYLNNTNGDNDDAKEWGWERQFVVLIDDQGFLTDLYNDGMGHTKYFSPEDARQIKDKLFPFYPNSENILHLRNKYEAYKDGKSYATEDFMLCPYIFFTGYIIDKSGRKVSDATESEVSLFGSGEFPINEMSKDVVFWYKSQYIINVAKQDTPTRAQRSYGAATGSWEAEQLVAGLRKHIFPKGPRPTLIAIMYNPLNILR